jgi:hypothetical protein
MNAIQQISLMLQLGIDPATDIGPELLRAMWLEKSTEVFGPARKAAAKTCASQQMLGEKKTD